jgi:hypothetical protein
MRGNDSILRALSKPPDEMRAGIHEARAFFERAKALPLDPKLVNPLLHG